MCWQFWEPIRYAWKDIKLAELLSGVIDCYAQCEETERDGSMRGRTWWNLIRESTSLSQKIDSPSSALCQWCMGDVRRCYFIVKLTLCSTACFHKQELNKSLCVPGFEVLTAVATKSFIFWNITPCGLVKFNRRFKGNITSVCPVCRLLPFGLFFGILFDPEDGADIFLRKVRLLSHSYM
jgi:hypothetical protein